MNSSNPPGRAQTNLSFTSFPGGPAVGQDRVSRGPRPRRLGVCAALLAAALLATRGAAQEGPRGQHETSRVLDQTPALPAPAAGPGATAGAGGLFLDLDVMDAPDFVPDPSRPARPGVPPLHVPGPTDRVALAVSPEPPLPEFAGTPDIAAYLQEHPDHAGAWMLYGQRLYLGGNMTGSLDAFEHLYRLQPESPAAVNNYAALLAAIGRHDEAVTLLAELVLRHPTYGRARFNLACAYVFKGSHDMAMRELERAATLGWEPLAVHLGDPDLDPLRDRPDFVELLRRAGTIPR